METKAKAKVVETKVLETKAALETKAKAEAETGSVAVMSVQPIPLDPDRMTGSLSCLSHPLYRSSDLGLFFSSLLTCFKHCLKKNACYK